MIVLNQPVEPRFALNGADRLRLLEIRLLHEEAGTATSDDGEVPIPAAHVDDDEIAIDDRLDGDELALDEILGQLYGCHRSRRLGVEVGFGSPGIDRGSRDRADRSLPPLSSTGLRPSRPLEFPSRPAAPRSDIPN